MADKLGQSFKKNTEEMVGFAIGEGNGAERLDVQVNYMDPEGNLKSTSKGVYLCVGKFKTLEEVKNALKKKLQQDKKDETSETTETK